MSDRKYTAAVIGVGKASGGGGERIQGFAIGHVHGEAFKRNPRVDLVAGADINDHNLKFFCEKFQAPQRFNDYRRMLDELKPDVVSIGTYVGLHAEMIEASAEAGVKGIVCEKPFVNSPADLRRVREVLERTGVKLVGGHMRRYLGAFQRARELYSGGTVGNPVMCMAGIPNWDLSEWGSHWLDMFRFLHEDRPVRWVFGQGRVREHRGFGQAMEDHAVAYFEFEGGGKGVVDGGARVGECTMTLVGSEGTIRVYGEGKLVVDTAEGRKVEEIPGDHQSAWDAVVHGLLDWIEGGEEPTVGLTQIAASAELNLAAYLSMVRGDRVDLPLDEEAFEMDEWPVDILARRYTART